MISRPLGQSQTISSPLEIACVMRGAGCGCAPSIVKPDALFISKRIFEPLVKVRWLIGVPLNAPYEYVTFTPTSATAGLGAGWIAPCRNIRHASAIAEHI